MFEKDWNIEKFLKERGETVKVVTDDSGVLELTDVDIAGSTVELPPISSGNETKNDANK